MSRHCVLLGALLLGCGGAPAPAPGPVAAAPTSEAPMLPNPCTANPCDAVHIDPSVNPCVGAAGEAAAAPATDAATP